MAMRWGVSFNPAARTPASTPAASAAASASNRRTDRAAIPTAAYTYDAGKRRIRQILNETTTLYRWDEFSPYGDIVVETDGAGAIQASYVLGNGQLISQTHGGTTD